MHKDDLRQLPDHVRVRRAHHKARCEREIIDAILDAQPLAHLGVVVKGRVRVIPTLQWREGDHVYVHGSAASAALRAAVEAPVCLTVSILDGYKLARSGFHHSVNYRSVMIHGIMRAVPEEEREARLNAMIDTLFPGRAALLRPMNDKERKATAVLYLPLDEAVAKVDDTGVIDEEEDYAWPVWAGSVPVREVAGEPVPDARNLPEMELPDHVVPAYLRGGK